MVSLSKEESIKRINLRKESVVSLAKTKPALNGLKSRIGLCLDFSYSMEKFYKNGTIQELVEKLIPLALAFDDNGELDFWLFDTHFHRLPTITMNNFYGYVATETSKYHMGATYYSSVMQDVYNKYIVEEPDNIPNYVLFITDGDCSDKQETFDVLIKNAIHPVFWQFIGVGSGHFDTLEALDDIEGRYVDNADFFSSSSIMKMSDDELYSKLLNEYPGYLETQQVKSMLHTSDKNIAVDNISSNNKEVKKMAVSLSKGGKVSLAKVAADAGVGSLDKITVGLGWDTNRYDGGADFDLDAAAFMLGGTGKVRQDTDFIFYNNKKGPGVEHTGDNRTGEGEGDDEQIKVVLSQIPADVEKVDFTVTIDQADTRNQNFGMVENSFIRIVDDATGTELIRYDLGEDFSVETAIVVAELYRNNGEWKFNAIGSGFAGGLAALCKNFGVDV